MIHFDKSILKYKCFAIFETFLHISRIFNIRIVFHKSCRRWNLRISAKRSLPNTCSGNQFLLSIHCCLSFGCCIASAALRRWNFTCMAKCEGAMIRRRENVSSFTYSLPRNFVPLYFAKQVKLHRRSSAEATH